MGSLVSPEYSLKAFCEVVRSTDPLKAMEAVSAELGSAHRLHQEATNEFEFPEGSKGRVYCDSLQMLISTLMNGSVPDDVPPNFLTDVKPLVDHLLQNWELGNLRQVFANVQQPSLVGLALEADPLVVVVSREEVEAMDMSAALAVLMRLVESPETARAFVERVDISFHGYDHTNEELFEIVEVRNFVQQLDEKFPFWFFFLSKRYLGLQCLLYCFLPPFLTEEARSRDFPERIDQLLSKRWFPAMSHISQFAGFSEKKIERLAERGVSYITNGRFSADAEPFA